MNTKLYIFDPLKRILLEDAGYKFDNSGTSGVRFIFGIDEGWERKIKAGTLGVRCNFYLKETPDLKGQQYPQAKAAKKLYYEIEQFILKRYEKTFQSDLYKIEGFSKRHVETGITGPSFKDYESQLAFKFNRPFVVDIYDQVTMKQETDLKDIWKVLSEEPAYFISVDKLFKPHSTDCWGLK